MFDQAKQEQVLEHIASGNSLRSLAKSIPGIESAVYRALAAKDSPFCEKYARARELQAEADADAVSEIRDRVLADDITPEQGRVALDALKWSAGKRNPRKYGDRIQLDGDLRMEVTVNDPTLRARATLLPSVLPKPDDTESA